MIVCENVSFSYDALPVLSHFSCTLPLSSVTALRGPSGCGKSTLLHLLAGLIRPEEGEIKGLEHMRTALLFQENRLLPWRSALQHISDVSKDKNQAQNEAWLSFVELSDVKSHLPHSLSGGMARRLALARALALDGDILLLDEPFAGVDLPCATRILTRMKTLTRPILFTSHEEGLLPLCDKVLSFHGTPLSLLEKG